jgi:adenine-specific DNA-methyltransferase
MDGKSRNLTDDYIKQIKALFPEAVREVADNEGNHITHKIDMEKLAILLGEAAIPTDETEYRQKYGEKFSFEWAGKRRAIAEAQKRSTGTLRPCPEESVDWDTTENLYIEGDNLEVLKLLQDSYIGAVKMIYIDPPYNTGKDFVYKDNYKDNLANYLEQTNTTNAVNSEASGRYHTNWLNMMYPRLKLARNLLTEDGIILINMDEHEVINLQAILNEVYGEDNDLGTIIWDKRNPKGDAKGISYQHEYILAYAKNKTAFLERCPMQRPKKNAEFIIKKAAQYFGKINSTYSFEQANKDFSLWVNSQIDFSGGEKAYNKIDRKGNVYQSVSMAWPNKKTAPDDYFIPLIHPITKKECPVPERGWRNPSSTMKELLDKGLILFGNDETTQPRRKYPLSDNMNENIPSLLYYGGSDTDLLAQMGIPFDTPKVIDVCKEHILSFTNKDSIILDFFSGSATTAHAVMQLNAEDGGNRKYICVQLPELTYEGKTEIFINNRGEEKVRYVIDKVTNYPVIIKDSEARKAGFWTIPEIAKERIRRAGKKILEEQKAKNDGLFADEAPKLDIDFKVFKLDRSNVKEWDVELEGLNEQEAAIQLQAEFNKTLDILKDGRTELDILYEVMLKLGLLLTTHVKEVDIEGKKAFVVGDGVMVASFAKGLTYAQISKMLDLKAKFVQAGEFKVVFADESFASDNDKTNAMQLFKQRGITNYEII